MNKIDKIALEVAGECFADRKANKLPTRTFMATDEELIEFARRLVAKLSEGHEFFGYVNAPFDMRKLYLHPPLTDDTRTLDVLRQALGWLESIEEPPLNLCDEIRTLITELENKS